jgi:DNA recombination protein Rad52
MDSSSTMTAENQAAATTVESQVTATFRQTSTLQPKAVEWVRNPSDGSVLLDHNARPISVDRILATKPLRAELSTRPGPGNKKLTYLSGEGVSRMLNDIFGFDGWSLDIKQVQREECIKDDSGKYHVVYTAQVRLTHKSSGAYKEDCGSGDSTDKNFGTAISHALKASITDAMKRAARHFGDKLGNCTLLFRDSFP